MTSNDWQLAQIVTWDGLLSHWVHRAQGTPVRVLQNGQIKTVAELRELRPDEGDEQSRAHYVRASFAEDEPDPGQDEHPGWIMTRSELAALLAEQMQVHADPRASMVVSGGLPAPELSPLPEGRPPAPAVRGRPRLG